MQWTTLGLQNSCNYFTFMLDYFHDFSLLFLIMITFMLSISLTMMTMMKQTNLKLSDSQFVELGWTIIPAVVLVLIAIPSLQMLYAMEENNTPMITLKVMGHQWYWTYEFMNLDDCSVESYMVPESMLCEGDYRLLEVDSRLSLPTMVMSRVLVSSADVLHSWTIPSLGVKADATPGRLNQLNMIAMNSGVMYGQCSEICGTNHSFMPIVVEFISKPMFMKWVLSC